GDRTIKLTLSKPAGAGTLGGPSTALLTVVDDNGSLTLNQRFVTQAYLDLLQRRPEPAGLAVWIGLLDHSTSRADVVRGIIASTEYRTLEARGLYERLLHRPADASGLRAFVTALGAGATQEQVEAAMTASPEYLEKRGGGSNPGFLDSLYQDA